jgi:hypothetical protein
MNGVQAFGGLCETSLGGATALQSAGLAAVPGGMLMAHGLDHVFTGCRQMVSGEYQNSATNQLLRKTGMSHQTAATLDSSTGILGSIASSAFLMAVERSVAYSMPLIMESNSEYACSSTQAIRLRNSLIAREIAGGARL